MTPHPTALPPMGPPPFKFAPAGGLVKGPAFSLTFKLIGTAIVLGCAAAVAQLWLRGPAQGTQAGAWFLAGAAMLAVTWWFILRSETRIDATGLHQSWVWDKHTPLDELAYGKLIRVRGLEAVIAPRLYVRTLMGKFSVYYGATPELVGEFERLVAELKAFRGL